MSSLINHLYEFGEFRLDPTRRLLKRDGKLVPLKPKVFDTLLVLVTSGGIVVEKDELLKEVWGGVAVEEVGLAKNISTLRKALGESPEEHRYIVTVPGRGYRFVSPVTSVPAEAAGTAIEGIEEEVIETHTIAQVISVEEEIEAEVETPKSLPAPRHGSLWLPIGIGAGILMVMGGALAFYFHRPPALRRTRHRNHRARDLPAPGTQGIHRRQYCAAGQPLCDHAGGHREPSRRDSGGCPGRSRKQRASAADPFGGRIPVAPASGRIAGFDPEV